MIELNYRILGEVGERKYILVEMGTYFDTVLKPRIQKVVYSKDWKDGKPQSRDTGISHVFKYFRIESYEDALANLQFHHADAGQELLKLDDEYLLKYCLDFETRGSATLLNHEQLERPFSYRLTLHDGTETREKPVDLPETFNYLIGLIVNTRRVHFRTIGSGNTKTKQKYLCIRGKANVEGDEVAVLWRELDTSKWREADYKAEAEWVKNEKLLDGADRIYINATSTIENALSLDGVFQRLMFNEAP